jgi:hypothetical protein
MLRDIQESLVQASALKDAREGLNDLHDVGARPPVLIKAYLLQR